MTFVSSFLYTCISSRISHTILSLPVSNLPPCCDMPLLQLPFKITYEWIDIFTNYPCPVTDTYFLLFYPSLKARNMFLAQNSNLESLHTVAVRSSMTWRLCQVNLPPNEQFAYIKEQGKVAGIQIEHNTATFTVPPPNKEVYKIS